MAVRRTSRLPTSRLREGFTGEVAERTWPSAVAGVAAIGLVVYMALDSGGYFPPPFLAAGTLACIALAVLLVLRPPHYPLSTPALVGLSALIGLVFWTALSTRWSSASDDGLPGPGLG